VCFNQTAVVERLVEKGANIKAKDEVRAHCRASAAAPAPS
jgi:hypothetical protein